MRNTWDSSTLRGVTRRWQCVLPPGWSGVEPAAWHEHDGVEPAAIQKSLMTVEAYGARGVLGEQCQNNPYAWSTLSARAAVLLFLF